ncbi:MAG: thiamine diphosphokinase [Caldilineaceae bacterium]|nr:thiamine diphosphokinase [Caldilineaceae bacterium]
MRAVIFVNGVVNDYPALARRLRPDDYLIAADGGARHCAALGLRPAVLVGDLDSISPARLADYEQTGVEIERHPPRKDETDLELAVRRAMADGASEILLLGALGGRLDQTLANLLLPARQAWPVPILLADDRQLARVVRGGESVTIYGAPGDTVSAIPLSAEATGITYTGLEYPLTDATLPLGSTQGISNQMAGDCATIRLGSGILLVVQEGGE